MKDEHCLSNVTNNFGFFSFEWETEPEEKKKNIDHWRERAIVDVRRFCLLSLDLSIVRCSISFVEWSRLRERNVFPPECCVFFVCFFRTLVMSTSVDPIFGLIQISTSIKIKRSDGRAHLAEIVQLSPESKIGGRGMERTRRSERKRDSSRSRLWIEQWTPSESVVQTTRCSFDQPNGSTDCRCRSESAVEWTLL